MKNVIQEKKDTKDERIKDNSKECPECETKLEEEDGPQDAAVSSYMTKLYCPKCGAYNLFRI